MAEVFFNGPAGRLEGRFHRSENPRAPLVLVLHPHPAQGGTMNNRVTYATFQAFVNMGFSVLRFNYRGVGNSQGEIDGTGVGELADAIVALDWLQNMDSETSVCWIAGYSFGAWVAAQVLMRRPEISGFVFVSPPTNMYQFDFLSPCPASGLIIQGGKDTVVSEASVEMLAEQLAGHRFVHVEYRNIPQADHLYSKNLKEMHDIIVKMVPDIKSRRPKKTLKKVKNPEILDDY
ncbi:MAG: alpha/beta hydrolase [Alphaproteobacteria bacterium]|nr:alpha/beta hydrolase [Alphaproteobacteria bacterium]